MAKCGITNIGGGGGIGSDELTVTKDYVLSGLEYVGADTDDEKGVGIMINNGTTANQNLNASGSFLVKGGYHAQPFTVNANSLASQTSGTATSSKMLNGETAWVNGSKITGAIVSMGGQTINPTASQQTVSSSGKYMTGNVVVNGVSNLTAANIKKGANVGGTVGTFEGYVPTATDLYLRGNNVAGFNEYYRGGLRPANQTQCFRFDAGQITVIQGADNSQYLAAQRNLTGYNNLNIEWYSSGAVTLSVYVSASLPVYIYQGTAPTTGGTFEYSNSATRTTSLNVSAINATVWVLIKNTQTNSSFYRIWLT